LYTAHMDLVPPDIAIHKVLDIACGPGEWAIRVAQAFPQLSVMGIDISNTMVTEAKVLAEAENVSNALFLVMDARNSLLFPDDSFDLVNCRLLSSVFQPDHWPALMAECFRLVRPGGICRLTEFEISLSNSVAIEELNTILNKVLFKLSRSFSPLGRSIGITPLLKPLLQQAGFKAIRQKSFAIDCSATSDYFPDWREDVYLLCQSLKHLFVAAGEISQEEFDALYLRVKHDLSQSNFSSLDYCLTVEGFK
jgi:ubiquinone/menaquinone biosynthesis C-methylase UbiE